MVLRMASTAEDVEEESKSYMLQHFRMTGPHRGSRKKMVGNSCGRLPAGGWKRRDAPTGRISNCDTKPGTQGDF